MVMLPLNNDASEKGQLLVWGGSSTSGDTTTTVVELLTPNPSTSYTTFTFQTIAPCNFGRRHAPAAYLPDGKIVCFGGTNFQNQLSGAYYNAEIFDPVAKSWTVVDGMTVPKVYHASGILLLDGRVWLAGDSYAKNQWELRSEYYVPAYYDATRPTISSEPAVGDYGGTINIPTPDAADIEKVSLIRLSTFTHGFNSELRFIWLQIQSKGSNNVTVSAPVNAKIAPPGWYMIHVLNSAGMPSKAKVIKIPGTASSSGDTTSPSVAITSPANGATISGPSTGVTVNVAGTASDNSGGSGIQKVEVQIGSANSFKLANPKAASDWSTWSASDVVTSEGSYTITARATDNAGNTKDATITVTVAFSGGGGGTYTSIYSVTGVNYGKLYTGSLKRAGEYMHKNTTYNSALIGQSVKRVVVILAKSGNPTGTISVVVRRFSDDSIVHTFGTVDASQLTTSNQNFTLEATSSYTIAANDRILVEWNGTGSSTDQVWVRKSASDTSGGFDGQNTKWVQYITSYTIQGTYDLAGEWFKLV
jgi:hypothetical protein